MKRLYIFATVLVLSCLSVSAQQLFLEYDLGHGSYNMSGLKDWFSAQNPSLSIKNIKTTDNFPGYMTHSAKIGMTFGRFHRAGLLIDYMNTAGKKGVADYSADYKMTFRVKGLRTGVFYRFSSFDLNNEVFAPYLQLSAGTVFNHGKYSEGIKLTEQGSDSKSQSLGGVNLFMEPALGFRIRLTCNFSLNANIGYEYDITKRFSVEGQKAAISPDWSGLRLQGGLVYYIPLKK